MGRFDALTIFSECLFMERMNFFFGSLVVRGYQGGSHETRYSCNPRRSIGRIACRFRAKLSRHDLATRCEFSEGRYEDCTEECEEAHGQHYKASLEAHEIKCAAWARQFIQSGCFHN
jgi:hypothetical protein